MLISSLTFFGQSNRNDGQADYQLAFASFAPLNTDIFIADADGSDAKPLLAHPGLDYNASFSNDGKWIMFTSERKGSADIYRCRVDGSSLERIVDDPAFDDQAALSPDGKHLAFVSSRTGQADIWILELQTKKLRNLTNSLSGDFRPSWSPDGRWIAFSSDRDSRKLTGAGGFGTAHSTEVYLIGADGKGVRRITQAFAGSPAWAPDGKRLVFYETEHTEFLKIVSAQRLRGTTQIASINLETNEKQVLTTGAGEKWSPRWMSSERVAYAGGGSDGGLEFTTGPGGVRGEFNTPTWSADGRQMVFHREVDRNWPPFRQSHSHDPQFGLIRTGVFPSFAYSNGKLISNDKTAGILHNSILSMNADGSGRSVLFTDAEKSALAPVWSPKGDKIVFALGRFFQTIKGPALADIAIINSDGTGLKIMTKGDGNYAFPSWSPDGRRVVFRASNKDLKGLFIVDVETAEIKVLTSNSHDNFPSWSPTGDVIAFTSYRDGDYEIYTIKPDGTDPRRLTNSRGNDAHCAWSSDGKWIAFASQRGGFKDEAALHPFNPQPYGEIFAMRSDGSDVRMLTDNQFEEATPAFAPSRRH